MEKISSLYDFAKENNIQVDAFRLGGCESLCVMDDDGDCYIALDPAQVKSDADEALKLAHEIGHCVSGAFYNQYSPLSDKGQCERRADVWAIKRLIPKNELIAALKSGITELWELAEHFDVPDSFMAKAVEYYNLRQDVPHL